MSKMTFYDIHDRHKMSSYDSKVWQYVYQIHQLDLNFSAIIITLELDR